MAARAATTTGITIAATDARLRSFFAPFVAAELGGHAALAFTVLVSWGDKDAMPSVEIVCVGQAVPTQFENVPFRVYAENRLISHRTPSPLFQADFDALSGCIYHLVEQPNGAATAYSLLDEWWEALRFKPEYVPSVGRILSELLAASPQGRLLFTSDYQFGPDPKRYKRPMRIGRFWELHTTGRLRANTLYPLIQDKPA